MQDVDLCASLHWQRQRSIKEWRQCKEGYVVLNVGQCREWKTPTREKYPRPRQVEWLPPRKYVLINIKGGSSDCQKGFLETLSSDNSAKRIQSRHGSKQPPVAHDFALGYTYHDVLDADHEGL
jgi:hypothetical protein